MKPVNLKLFFLCAIYLGNKNTWSLPNRIVLFTIYDLVLVSVYNNIYNLSWILENVSPSDEINIEFLLMMALIRFVFEVLWLAHKCHV